MGFEQAADVRLDPPLQAGEAETLLGFLAYHRDTLRWKTSGLDAVDLRRPLAPSSMTLGGLLKHLAYVEDNWWRVVWLGSEPSEPWAAVDWSQDRDWEWHSAAADSPEELRAGFDAAVARSDAIVAAALASGGLDATSAGADRHTGERFTLRWIVVHLVEEYARHNGHADLLRENVDGLVGE
ncbi:DinB family protein [Luteimicrobium sp. DT211]|uniref:DinB family protein n=1 Tax=Luteimicrobium sp. DT211 TaxID=3393412 RepID=UPI003CF6DC71